MKTWGNALTLRWPQRHIRKQTHQTDRCTDKDPGMQTDTQTDRQVDPVALQSNISPVLLVWWGSETRYALSDLSPASFYVRFVPISLLISAFFLVLFCRSFCVWLSFHPLCPWCVPTSQGAVPALPDEHQAVCACLCVCVGVCRLACLGASGSCKHLFWRGRAAAALPSQITRSDFRILEEKEKMQDFQMLLFRGGKSHFKEKKTKKMIHVCASWTGLWKSHNSAGFSVFICSPNLFRGIFTFIHKQLQSQKKCKERRGGDVQQRVEDRRRISHNSLREHILTTRPPWHHSVHIFDPTTAASLK